MIPRCMSTQHPDNVTAPFFASSPVIAGEDEIREAYYAFSHLGCDEQMWDVEGKEIDNFVVKKLLTYYPEFFREHPLGEELRLTLRVPNPALERAEAKILLETLESIPRSYDAARLFYDRDLAPIFEVILPMTTSAREVDHIYRYYADFIAGRQHARFRSDGLTIAEWIGAFAPERIQVIPLFEDVPTMMRCDEILAEYLSDKEIAEQRVFLARSDTAMNYGFVAAALANKIALQRMDRLAQRCGVRLHPILGMGSAPFRGGLSPATVERVGREYPSVVTFTVQSAFKFDHPVEQVRAACARLRQRAIGPAGTLDEERARELIGRYSAAYRRRVVELAPAINRMARYIPSRRARKLHVGLFGYARGLDNVTLPRAIAFTGALYSLGFPPELIALETLSAEDWTFVRSVYPSVEAKLADALRFTDPETPFFTPALRDALARNVPTVAPDVEHARLVRRIRLCLETGDLSQIEDLIVRAAHRRRFLG